MMKNLEIRKLTPAEMSLAIDWADNEGWNPGLDDEMCFYNADTEGFFGGFLDNKMVSLISAVKYDTNYGFIGFYIVHPDFRGKGYGLPVWNKAIDYLSGRSIGLDAVPVQVENYSKSGFKYAHLNKTFKSLAVRTNNLDKDVQELSFADWDIIRTIDKRYHPDTRDDFLKCWLKQEHSFLAGYFDGDILVGYGKIRKCRHAYKMGPLFAPTKDVAQSLLNWLRNKIHEGSEFTLDIPVVNTFALELAEENNMELVFETVRMYKGEVKPIHMDHIYGLTSYELG